MLVLTPQLPTRSYAASRPQLYLSSSSIYSSSCYNYNSGHNSGHNSGSNSCSVSTPLRGLRSYPCGSLSASALDATVAPCSSATGRAPRAHGVAALSQLRPYRCAGRTLHARLPQRFVHRCTIAYSASLPLQRASRQFSATERSGRQAKRSFRGSTRIRSLDVGRIQCRTAFSAPRLYADNSAATSECDTVTSVSNVPPVLRSPQLKLLTSPCVVTGGAGYAGALRFAVRSPRPAFRAAGERDGEVIEGVHP